MRKAEKQRALETFIREHPGITHQALDDEMERLGVTTDDLRDFLQDRGVPVFEADQIEQAQQTVLTAIEHACMGHRSVRSALVSVVLARLALTGRIDFDLVVADARDAYTRGLHTLKRKDQA